MRRPSPALRSAPSLTMRTGIAVSELRVARHARERDHVADVLHAGHELHDPLEAEPETRVRRAAEAPQVEVPAVVGGVESGGGDPAAQHLLAMLALRATDDLADLRHQ